MAYRSRVIVAVGLVILGALAIAFLFGGPAASCLGPIGVTAVECIRSSGIAPNVGIGLPIGVAILVGAALLVLPVARNGRRGALVGGALGAVAGTLAYLAFRATTMTGPTSTGDVITVELPIDVYAAVAAALAACGLGAVIGSRLRSVAGAPRT